MRFHFPVALGSVALLAACSHGAATLTARDAPTTTTSTPATTAPPVTSAPTTRHATASATARPGSASGIGRGSSSAQVLSLEQRLDALHYDVGSIDGVYDGNTSYAVMAFQKVNGLPRTGRATQNVLDRLNAPIGPGTFEPGGGATRVEVDLPRQVLLLFRGNALFKILPVSTGSGARFCVDGRCDRAVTPGGAFRISRRIRGWHTSPLGKLYNPMFFNQGIAIHGALSVPGYPASHGCVRIPMFAAGWFYQLVPNGTPVYVIGGPHVPPPLSDLNTTTTSSTSTSPSTSTSSTTTEPTTSTTTPPTTTSTTVVP